MNILSTVSSDFSSRTRQRGETYFRDGRVDLIARDVSFAAAEVRGSGAFYAVEVGWDDEGDVDFAQCTCPHFADGFFCKHIWATLLEWESQPDDDGNATSSSPFQTYSSRTRKRTKKRRKKGKATAPGPAWRQHLESVETEQKKRQMAAGGSAWVASLNARPREVWYVINVAESQARGGLHIEFLQRQRRANGQPGTIKPLSINVGGLRELNDPVDRDLLARLLDVHSFGKAEWNSYRYSYSPKIESCPLSAAQLRDPLPDLCESGRLVWRLSEPQSPEECPILSWDDGLPWQLHIDVNEEVDSGDWRVQGVLFRQNGSSRQQRPLSEAVYVDPRGVVLFQDHLARCRIDEGTGAWLTTLRRVGTFQVPKADRDQFARQVGRSLGLDAVQLPDTANLPVAQVSCQPRLRVIAEDKVSVYHQRRGLWFARIDFVYDGASFSVESTQRSATEATTGELICRQPRQEAEWLSQLGEDVQPAQDMGWRSDGAHVQFRHRQLPEIVTRLTAAGWIVEAQGVRIRQPGKFSMSVSSSTDWFDLEAELDFDGASVSLPELLKAVERGEEFVRLDDGSQGLLPEDWLKKYGHLAALGEAEERKIRFRPSQAMLLDTLLAAQPDPDVDAQFRAFTRRLKSFDGVQPKSSPRTFQGELRGYQQEGLGWLHFLKDFRLGGCLADDMGLGKTVQVLALLESRRIHKLKQDERRLPSLVVVPKSLIFNWVEEAARFTPGMKVAAYHGRERADVLDQLDQYHVVVTTYATLRRDVVKLKDQPFDYAILDEAQAIKNPQSGVAKACRLVNAQHRLVMTGTPVENHLGDLWSLFEFLNPGMLGRSSAFQNFSRGSNGESDKGCVDQLAAALKPYLLRRTKEQVLTDLPEKTELTLHCDMPNRQRKLYDELKDHYRASLLQRIETDGMAKSKIHVLEALLRLRQAACHPGLIDKSKSGHSSAKLDVLLERLEEAAADGHKALVFSQFTSLLKIVRDRLDKGPIKYAYLDGSTNNRQQLVERFQNDPDCSLFLISLKAGGHGLNLTAADYVFILDPWWNPAVEAQAVDRAHRIGQTKQVFAYRLICRDTIEERIVELQNQKRQLADAIVSADSSLIRTLTADDLQLLLS